jgi:hypothetical protein
VGNDGDIAKSAGHRNLETQGICAKYEKHVECAKAARRDSTPTLICTLGQPKIIARASDAELAHLSPHRIAPNRPTRSLTLPERQNTKTALAFSILTVGA